MSDECAITVSADQPRAAPPLSPGQPASPAAQAAVSGHSLLAWCGWQLQIPRAWQPLKLSGTPSKGQVIVGDEQCACFLVQWERPGRRSLSDGQEWVAARLKRHGALPASNPPAEAHFTACGWVEGLQTEEGKETSYWYGYAERASLLLGVTVNGALPAATRRRIVEDVLPTLRASAADQQTTWAMYDVSFVTPTGFRLVQRHLFMGDVALEFARHKRETLLLRQVYPGDLALGRRPFETWLSCYPFKEHRRLRRTTVDVQPWQLGDRPELTGLRRSAWKRLGIPLGWCAPRRSVALAVHDRRLNRLLVAEHMAPNDVGVSVCSKAIAQMNRHSA